MSAHPMTTKVFNEDVFRDVRDRQRASGFKGGRWVRYSQAITACEIRENQGFPVAQLQPEDWLVPLPNTRLCNDVGAFTPPPMYHYVQEGALKKLVPRGVRCCSVFTNLFDATYFTNTDLRISSASVCVPRDAARDSCQFWIAPSDSNAV